MSFKDHFSGQPAAYAAFRPRYPPELYDFVAALPDRRRLAWDCGTGSGQAAVGLARYFERVVATDASAAQIAHAQAAAGVEYRVARAEASGLREGSVDLVTVAQALHWFDIPAFLAEAARVLLPGGALAVWTYGEPALVEAALDEPFQRYTRQLLGSYWPPERQLVREGYRTLTLPFQEIDCPQLILEYDWTLAELGGYVGTWSATRAYVAARRNDPIPALLRLLAPAWGAAGARRRVRWPLVLRAGRKA